MANCNLKEAAIYRAIILDKLFFVKRAVVFEQIFLTIAFGAFFANLLQIFLYFEGGFLYWGFFSFSLFLFFLQIDLFFKHYIKKPKQLMKINDAATNIDKINIADYFDFELAKIINKIEAKGWADSYFLLYLIITKTSEIDFVFNRMVINKKQAATEIGLLFQEKIKVKEKGFSECFLKTIEDSFFVAQERGAEKITIEDVFVSLSEYNPYLQDILYREGLKKEDVLSLTNWQLRLKEKEDLLLYKNLMKRGKIGIEWASGYTPFLDRFAVDWTKGLKMARFPETIGHEEEGSALERVLSRNEISSALLVGEPGTGRKSIIQKIIKKSFLGESLPEVNHRRFLELNLATLIAHAQGNEETERVLDHIFREATDAGNVVLIIDEIHNYIEGEKRPGVVNISGILSSYLHHPAFRVIGITSYTGFRQSIEKNATILALFEKIEVKESSEEETLLLLERVSLRLENKYKKLIPFSSLKQTIILASRYMQESSFPEKAIDLLEEAMVYAAQQDKSILLPKDIDKIVSERTEIPVGDINQREKEILLNMENLLHERMINQNDAVRAVSYALRRSRADMDTRKGLIGSFLFLGPTGVGKTEMAKAIAAVYFGNEKKINRIDMSEFQSISDISRLIGSSTENGILTSRVREDPFSLVLLDEIEKAHPDILNLFLQILDEGHVTDGVGRKISFQNCMVIATSNAGYQLILESIDENGNWISENTDKENVEKDKAGVEIKRKILQSIFKRGIFRPEFVNRFDDTVLFKALGRKELKEIAGLQLKNMAKNLEQKDITFNITEELKDKIVEISYDPLFGAREMQRAIQNNIGDVLSSAMLRNEIEKGDVITINADNFTIDKIK